MKLICDHCGMPIYCANGFYVHEDGGEACFYSAYFIPTYAIPRKKAA